MGHCTIRSSWDSSPKARKRVAARPLMPQRGTRDRVMDVAVKSERSLKAARKVLTIWGSKGLLSPAAVAPVAERIAAEQPFERPFEVRPKPRIPFWWCDR